jgi:hypothetical protein
LALSQVLYLAGVFHAESESYPPHPGTPQHPTPSTFFFFIIIILEPRVE